MRKLIIIFLVVSFFSSCSKAKGDKHYFVCDILNSEKESPKSFDGKLNYSDFMVQYEKTSQGEYKASLGEAPGALGLQFKDNVLSEAYLRAGEQQGFYREIFDVYRFDLETLVLIHSYVYYISKEDFNKNYNTPLFMDYNQPLLFDLVSREAPKDYVKIGWDKTRWQCYEISSWKYLKYLFFALSFLFMA